jgi:hypothetical protein
MGKYGTNVTGLGAYEGDVNADNGATLVSTNSDGEKSLLLGPAVLGEIFYGAMANGNFEVLPNNPSIAISEENPLPYFTMTDTSSGRIVATSEPSSLAVGQNLLRFTMTSALAGDTLLFTRYVPVPTSEARSFGSQFRVAVVSATSSTNYQIRVSAQYILADQTTTTGTIGTGDYTGTNVASFIAALGSFGVELSRNPNTNGSAPADAAYLLITFGIVVTSTISGTVDISEARIDQSRIQYMVTDQTNPSDYGYASLFLANGLVSLESNELGPVGSRPKLQLSARSGDIVLNTTTQGYTISLTSASRTASTVTIVTTRAHGLTTGYEVVVAGITGAAGTTMNGTFIVTVTNTTTFTYTAAGTAGSGTVTSATVKAGPGTGIIYLQPAATAAGKVQVDGKLTVTGLTTMSGTAAVTGTLVATGDITGTAFFYKNNTNSPFIWSGNSSNGRLLNTGTVGTQGADFAASISSTLSGVLITKATAGQPTTNLAGTGTTDAFSDALRNGGKAVDTSNNRAYSYSNGWKYSALTTPSDSRLKEEITEISGALDTLRQLMPVAFKWKEPEAHGRTDCVSDDGKRLGFIADQVATTDLAHWVETLGVDDREAHLVDTEDVLAVSIPQNEMEALLVQALLDIDTRLKALESR